MKTTLILVSACLFALSSAWPAIQPLKFREENKYFSRGTYGLQEDFNDFLALVPVDEVIAIAMDYLANDAEVQSAVDFIMSDGFKNMILEVEGIKEYQKFIKYLNDSGLPIYEHLQKLHELLGLPPFVPPVRSLGKSVRRGTGIRGLVDDIEAILPIDKIKALYNEKLQSSPEFKKLIETMSSDEFKSIVDAVRANPEYQELIKRAKEHGLDIEVIAELLNKIFGWGIETRFFSHGTYGLQEDLNDFLALLPTDQIIAIAMDYLANDAEVQDAIAFIMSEEFKQFILDVEAIKEYQEFLKYLNDAGLDVYEHLRLLHEALGLPPFVPPFKSVRMLHRRGTGIRGLVDDIEAILPIEKLKALFQEKLKSSPEFKKLIDTMSSAEFKKIVDEVRANPQYQELMKRAKEHGLDIEIIAELVNKIFGWGIESY